MKFKIEREKLLKPLQLIAGVVEKRQTLPILANILLVVKKHELLLTGTDLEVELMGRVALNDAAEEGAVTVPARKLMDICRSLSDEAVLEFILEEPKLIVRSGRSRFSLATLPAGDFPNTEELPGQLELNIAQQDLRGLMDRTQFAMAQQDVRYYLNGIVWEVKNHRLTCVATDGHRMALSSVAVALEGQHQVIVPRKAVLELGRLLADASGDILLTLGSNQLRVKADDYTFTSKLIDGRFPDYTKVVPQGGDKILVLERDNLRQALSRVAILASEKHRSVRLELRSGLLRVLTNNPEQEEADEELSIVYQGGELDIGFNVGYLLDAVAALPGGQIKVALSGPDSSARLEAFDDENTVYVVMPMRL